MADDVMFGFDPGEIDTSAPTRSARLKWVIVVDDALSVGRQSNAVACVAAATQAGVSGLLGPDAVDADGARHPGLPWAGCTILGAGTERMTTVLARASTRPEVFVADMAGAAQETRVYDEYLETVGRTPSSELGVRAVSLVGPRKAVDKIIGGLSLLA
ncbi:DUF2000 domain-containing protein [Amnibacterium flavum]|uniref:DUF2000 domain-containing protein n=1 Tax=Amnibacterium flavum TaxID=2173173 RepID=A0A2V1HQL6_9MICO|nr:DUF2000 domain-containing protein [Amnibacterium flavum]PVZ94893.1 DUF2000 domain-containing protein [Amnibacterium flavum]